MDILKAEPGPVSVSLRVYLQDRVQEMEFTILQISNIQEPWRARRFLSYLQVNMCKNEVVKFYANGQSMCLGNQDP